MFNINFEKIQQQKLDVVHFIFVFIGIAFLYFVFLVGSFLGSWLLFGEGDSSHFYDDWLPYVIIGFPLFVVLLVLWLAIRIVLKEDNYSSAKSYLTIARYSVILVVIVEMSILFDSFLS